jgi:hypothetical protein
MMIQSLLYELTNLYYLSFLIGFLGFPISINPFIIDYEIVIVRIVLNK